MIEQFKEGQYIRNIKTNEVGEVQMYGEESNYPNGCYFVYSFGNEVFHARDCELWKPKDEELCIFWEKEENGDFFPERPFIDIHCGDYEEGDYVSTAKMCGNSYWNYCEPFIGKKPEILNTL